MAVLRPLKRNDTRTYRDLIASLAPLDVDILALEVDDDLDRAYAEINRALDAIAVLEGVVPGGTLAPVYIGLTPPAAPSAGALWWRPDDGNLYVYYVDATSGQWVPAMASVAQITTGQWYLVAGAVTGSPPAAALVTLHAVTNPCQFPIGLTGSQALAKVAPAADADFDVQVNGVSRGIIRYPAGGTVATFTWPTAVDVVAGDRIEVLAPVVPDATLADVTWTLRGEI